MFVPFELQICRPHQRCDARYLIGTWVGDSTVLECYPYPSPPSANASCPAIGIVCCGALHGGQADDCVTASQDGRLSLELWGERRRAVSVVWTLVRDDGAEEIATVLLEYYTWPRHVSQHLSPQMQQERARADGD